MSELDVYTTQNNEVNQPNSSGDLRSPTELVVGGVNAPLPIYTFIHIPKCGGSPVENYFEQHYSDRIFGTTHKWLSTKDNNPIVIIREPIERFISLYYYWKNGSHGRNSRNQEFIDKYGKYTISDFIRTFKTCVPAINGNYMHELSVGFTWRVHFFKQVYLFWNADFIISAHGAALANLAFCKPKTKIIEIKPESQPGNYFKKISKINNLNYICMGTNALNNNCNGDIIISLKQIEIFIKMLDNKVN